MPPTPAYDWLDVFYTCTGCKKRVRVGMLPSHVDVARDAISLLHTSTYDFCDTPGCKVQGPTDKQRDAMWKDAVAQTMNRYHPDALTSEGSQLATTPPSGKG